MARHRLSFFRRASAAVNYLKRFHEKKKKGPKPNSLYLDHIIRKSKSSHYCRDQHFRPQRDIFVIKVQIKPCPCVATKASGICCGGI